MVVPSTHEVTQLLRAWTTGDEQALEKLTPLVYEQLRRVAQHHMAGQRPGHILQTTALVNEVYLQLLDCGQMNWQDRAHFFADVGAVDAAHSDRLSPAPAAARNEAVMRFMFRWTRPLRSARNPIRTWSLWTTR